MQVHLKKVQVLFDMDWKNNAPGVEMPDALSKNIHMPTNPGAGSGYFPTQTCQMTQEQEFTVAITFTSRIFKELFELE
ncbi:MAG: hypothetical protein ACYC3O_12715 [Burkholderiales bacterium]